VDVRHHVQADGATHGHILPHTTAVVERCYSGGTCLYSSAESTPWPRRRAAWIT
jgi:hypothetical protein